jgi:NodT family efflux transporter outer membrane factor (OMF) lipoprotein
LFGRNRSDAQAADYHAEASAYDRDALAIIVAADTARRYFEILAFKDRLKTARVNLSNAEEVARIVDARFNEGRVSGLEAAQQRTALANTQAALASVESQLAASESALAVLLARAPQEFDVAAQSLNGISGPAIAPALPARLIEQRPDIRRDEAELKAANADIGAARAAFFPGLTLSADAALLGSPSGAATSLAASLLAPIFRGGALTGGLEFANARQKELAENYRKTVLTSFKEVEDALAAVKAADERQKQFGIAAAQAANAYAIARARFEEGATDFQTLLDTQSAQLQADDNFTQARLERLTAAIALYKALGGTI